MKDNMLIFEIKRIPDLTLSKYQAFADSGIEGMLNAQTVFLRQLRGVLLLYNESLHYVYHYNPDLEQGNRLHIFICFIGDADKESIVKIIKSSVLSEYFFMEQVDSLPNCVYKAKSVLRKKERILQTKNNEVEQAFYVVPNWNINDKARLYNMYRMMQTFDKECCYIVDIFTEENMEEDIHKKFEKPLSFLRNINKKERGISELSKFIQNDRDPNSDETLRQYEEFLKKVDESTVFRARISVLSDDKNYCQLILDSVRTECLEFGNATVVSYQKSCSVIKTVRESIDSDGEEICIEKAPVTMKKIPTTYFAEELAVFTRFPVLYDGEYIEIPKETEVIPEEDGFVLGKNNNDYEVKIPLKMLPKHMFVCGIPGSGKTNTMLHIANSLWNYEYVSSENEMEKARIPFLILEPAKKEYRELALMDIPELLIFSPSASTCFPVEINPFEFAKGLTVSEHINNLCQVFEGAFPIEGPTPFILDRAIQAIYEKHGWNVKEINIGEKEYPIMSELYDQFEIEMNKTNYEGEIKDNIRSVLEVRIGSLLRREKKEIFNVEKSTLTPEEWIQKPIIMELESLGEATANFVTLLLCTLIREVLKANTYNDTKPRHVIFIEEAHNLIAPEAHVQNGQDSNPKIAATAFIVKMLAEVRALKEGIIIADQLPTAMAPEVIKNTNTKIVHRLTSGDDRGLVGSTMSASQLQLESMTNYAQGKALFSYEDLIRPYEIKVNIVNEHSDDNVSDKKVKISNDKFLYETMLEKEGFYNLCYERENKKFDNLKKMVNEVLISERNINRAIGEFDIKNSRNLFETFFESCSLKLRGIRVLKSDLLLKCSMIDERFVDSRRKKALSDVINVLGNSLEKLMTKLYVYYN